MNKNLYICYTYYHLYVSLLEIIYLKNLGYDNNYLIITDHIPKGQEIKDRILKNNIVKEIYYVEDLKLRRTIFLNPFYCVFYHIILNFLFKKNNKKLYENFKNELDLKINMFLDSTTTSHFYIYNFKNINLLEDGTLVYYPRKMILKDYIYKFLFIPQRVGRDKRINKIRVQNPDKLPKDIIKKGEKLDLKNYEKLLSDEEKEILLKIFSINLKLESEKEFKKKCLLLTQPLSEMKLVSEEEKIRIYQEIIEKFSDYDLYLKKHPRDLTNYPFKIRELDKNFPIELIKLLPNNFFAKVVAIESSAIYNLSDIAECINLGFDINDKLYRNIMKDKK